MDQDEGSEKPSVIALIGTPSQVADTVRRMNLADAGTTELTVTLLTRATTSREETASQEPGPACNEPVVDECVEEGGPPCPATAAALATDFDRAVVMLRSRYRLLPNQCLVLALRFRGFENEQAAHALGVETATVKFHIGNALRRIGVEPRTRLPRIFADAVASLEGTADVFAEEADLEWLSSLQKALRRLRRRADVPAQDLASGRAHPTAGSKQRGTP